MATKKTTKSDKTKKATKAEAAPPVEQTDTAPAMPAPAKAKAKKAKEPKGRKTSALDAALRVLEEAGQPMTCPEMIEAMATKGYWTSPGGATPAATLYSAILREINGKGKEARFVKTERGKFCLAKK
ncbi:MAG TPA: winged helix-turn-helix domain-containing protein [Gemmataceae bacterium]|nr:winged helix-turn-helix domain-containing protein [Gemmataceae bacterium]